MQLPSRGWDGDNRCMVKDVQEGKPDAAIARGPFVPGAIALVTLGAPRDKFWGMILALGPEGMSISGIELASFEDLVVMVKNGEPFTPAAVFFPMHRIERIELDLSDGSLPSLSQRFSAKTGLDPGAALTSTALTGAEPNGAEKNRVETGAANHFRKDPA
ncbi:MAG: hypothetical protein WBX38_04240 [Candidatus Sulfotelmatobacter sp.]